MKTKEKQKTKLEELFNATLVNDGNVEPLPQKTLPFSQALVVLIETPEGRELQNKRILQQVTPADFRKGIFDLAIKYRDLILVS